MINSTTAADGHVSYPAPTTAILGPSIILDFELFVAISRTVTVSNGVWEET